MADVYVNALTTISTEPTTTDSLVAVNRNTNEGKIIDYNLLADAILNKIASKQFSSLDTTSKLLVGAINELDSDIASQAAEISSLNSSLTPISYTGYSIVGYSSTDPTLSYVYIVGKICIYSLAFKGGTSETTPGHTETFVTGMPKPLHDSYGNGMSFNGNITQNFRYRVTSSGDTGIITNYYSGVRVYVGNPVIMTGAYIIA